MIEGCYYLPDTAATLVLGKDIAITLKGGDVLLLDGELGSGKTTLVKGIAKNLGVVDRVTSPTFSICNILRCEEHSIHHYDLFRLASSSELLCIGFEESLESGVITIIEWPRICLEFLRGDVKLLRMSYDKKGRNAEFSLFSASQIDPQSLRST